MNFILCKNKTRVLDRRRHKRLDICTLVVGGCPYRGDIIMSKADRDTAGDRKWRPLKYDRCAQCTKYKLGWGHNFIVKCIPLPYADFSVDIKTFDEHALFSDRNILKCLKNCKTKSILTVLVLTPAFMAVPVPAESGVWALVLYVFTKAVQGILREHSR